MEKKKNFLVYCGSAGIGKTHLLAALLGWAIKNFTSFRVFKEQTFLSKVRASMETFRGDYIDTVRYLIDDELLMLDDIASDKHSEWREEILFSVIDERYNSMKPTIITSNLSIDQFKEHFKERFCSRLFASDNIIIEIKNGEDFRANPPKK